MLVFLVKVIVVFIAVIVLLFLVGCVLIPSEPKPLSKEAKEYKKLLNICTDYYLANLQYNNNYLQYNANYLHYLQAANLFDDNRYYSGVVLDDDRIGRLCFKDVYHYYKEYKYSLILKGKVYPTDGLYITMPAKEFHASVKYSELDFKSLYRILYDTQKSVIPELMANERDKLLESILC